jgi:hypothetical protein
MDTIRPIVLVKRIFVPVQVHNRIGKPVRNPANGFSKCGVLRFA